jgi:hypothetical protein
MSKEKSITILANRPAESKDKDSRWDNAIADAEEMIRAAEGYARQLRHSIKMFRELRDSGARFIGQKKEAA